MQMIMSVTLLLYSNSLHSDVDKFFTRSTNVLGAFAALIGFYGVLRKNRNFLLFFYINELFGLSNVCTIFLMRLDANSKDETTCALKERGDLSESQLAALGIDLYVLSYRRVGECRRLGLFDNPMHNSHCSSGDFAEFRVDIQQALAEMRARGSYEQIIGYGHSTGAPILLDYLMEFGDGDFSGFVFNSPFLDWGWVGGSLAKMVVVHAPALFTRLGLWTETSELLGGGGFNVWALQLYSQYQFDPSCRPLYQVPVTIGYCTGINRVHADLRRRSAAGVPVTRKPFLVLTSKGDDVLNGETRRSEWLHFEG